MTNPKSSIARRSFLISSGLLASSAALAACTGSQGGAAVSKSKSLTGAGWQDAVTDLVFGQVAKDFEAKTGTTIKAQASVPFSDYQTRFRTLLAGGSPPDVMRLNDDFLREMSDKKSVLDLAPYIKKSNVNIDDYFANVYNFAEKPNGHAGMVIGTQSRVVFYNKTLFQKEGLPLPPTTWTSDGWTWDDFLAAAQALQKGSTQYGAVVNKDTSFENTFSVNNGGPGIFSNDGKAFTLADPEGFEAIQWVADLALKHDAAPPWSIIHAENAEQQLFAAGKLGMLFGASGGSAYYQQNVKNFVWDIAPVPAKVRQQQEGSMIVMVIPTKAENPDLAWEFLNFAAGPEGGKRFAEAGICIPVNRVASKSLTNNGKAPEHIGLFVEGADHNSSVNSTTATAQAVAIYRPQLERVFIGDITARDALTSVRDQVNAVL